MKFVVSFLDLDLSIEEVEEMEAGQSHGSSICKNLVKYSEPSEQQPDASFQPDASSLPPHLPWGTQMNQQHAPLYQGRPTDSAEPKDKGNPTTLGRYTGEGNTNPFAAALGHFFFPYLLVPFV